MPPPPPYVRRRRIAPRACAINVAPAAKANLEAAILLLDENHRKLRPADTQQYIDDIFRVARQRIRGREIFFEHMRVGQGATEIGFDPRENQTPQFDTTERVLFVQRGENVRRLSAASISLAAVR